MSISAIRCSATVFGLAALMMAPPAPVAAQLPDADTIVTASRTQSPGGRIRIEFGAGSIYDTNIEHDEDPIESFGIVTGGDVRYFSRPGRIRYTLQAEVAAHQYTQTDRYDRVSKLAAARFTTPLLGPLSAGLSLELSLQGRSQDRVINDQFTASPRLMMDVGEGGQARLAAAQRWRKSKATGATSDNQYVILTLRTAGSDRIAFDLRSRYERNESELDRLTYTRRSASGGVILPVREATWLEASLQYTAQDFTATPLGDDVTLPETEFRQDRRWTPQLKLDHELTRAIDLELEYEFERRTSNDPGKAYNAHNLSLFATYRLR